MQTVGVTGASGQLGNVVCRVLLDRGYHVKAFYRDDKTALIDFVVHAAAIISIHGDPTGIVHKTNTEGPKNVVEACIKQKVKRLIHVSSTHAVVELPFSTPFDETRAYKEKGAFAYDFSKTTGEQLILDYVRQGKIDAIVVRPSSVIGLYDYKPSEIGKALLDFYNQKIPMLPPGGYNFIDVRDISNSIVTAIDKGKIGEVYLLSGKYYTLKQFAAIVQKLSGKKVPKIVMPFWFLKSILPFVKLYGRIKKAAPIFTIEAITALKLGHPDMVNKKAQITFGHTCRPLEETIADFYDWNKSINKIK